MDDECLNGQTTMVLNSISWLKESLLKFSEWIKGIVC